jgi:hypothetical protein
MYTRIDKKDNNLYNQFNINYSKKITYGLIILFLLIAIIYIYMYILDYEDNIDILTQIKYL